jgi:predicted ATPase
MHMVLSLYHLLTRDVAQLERHTKSLAILANQYDLSFFADLAALFQSLLTAGGGDQIGIVELQKTDASLVAGRTLGLLPIFRTEGGHRALALGLQDEAMQLATMAQDLTDRTGVNIWLSDLHRLHAALANADGKSGAAENHLNTAVDVARQQGAKLWELRATIDLARLWQEQGRNDEAIALLEPVHKSLAEGDCPEDQATARELLEALAG